MFELRTIAQFRQAFSALGILLILQSAIAGSACAFPDGSSILHGMRLFKGGSKQKQSPVAKSDDPSGAQKQSGAGVSSALPTAKDLTAADLQSLAQFPAEIPNLRMVSGHLLRGAQPTEKGLLLLKNAGVKTIVNLRTEPLLVEKERRQAEQLGLKFVYLPMYTVQEPDPKTFDTFLATVSDASETPVFVHCLQGRDRTGTVVGAYRIAQEGWTFDAAFKEMMDCGFRPEFSPLTQGLHKFAQARGDKSPLPSASFILSDFNKRLHH